MKECWRSTKEKAVSNSSEDRESCTERETRRQLRSTGNKSEERADGFFLCGISRGRTMTGTQ